MNFLTFSLSLCYFILSLVWFKTILYLIFSIKCFLATPKVFQMAPKKSKKSKKDGPMFDFVEEEVTGNVDEEEIEEEEDVVEQDSDEDEPPMKKKKVAKREIKEEIELTDEKLQELLEKYEASKATATKTKDDFKHLPKNQRGKALKKALKKDKRARQDERAKIRDEMGESAPQKEVPKTIESMREYDATMVDEQDDEVEHDEANDEFSSYFNRETTPKIMITMTPKAKIVRLIDLFLNSSSLFQTTFKFCYELQKCIPNSEIFTRKNVLLKKIIEQAKEREFTDLLVVHEDRKKPNGIIFCHLPEGPTAYFKINSLTFTEDLKVSA